MLQGAFSFRGRIGRLRYFLDSMALGAIVVGGAIVVAVLSIPAKSPGMALLFGGICLILALPVIIWMSLTLQARRIRDIGLNPLYVMPACFMISIADALVARAMPHLAVTAHGGHTLVGIFINLGLSLALLFWPGNDRDDDELSRARLQVFDAEPEPEAPRFLVTRPTPSLRTPRTSFGRRGL